MTPNLNRARARPRRIVCEKLLKSFDPFPKLSQVGDRTGVRASLQRQRSQLFDLMRFEPDAWIGTPHVPDTVPGPTTQQTMDMTLAGLHRIAGFERPAELAQQQAPFTQDAFRRHGGGLRTRLD
jgi:hypothetical protein